MDLPRAEPPPPSAAIGPATGPAVDPPMALPPFVIERPAAALSPVVFVSAHSGRDYPPDLLAGARLDAATLRRSEGQLCRRAVAAAPSLGTPLLRANFARAYCDANREAWELDPTMFRDPLPAWVNTRSARVTAGLGTIARVVASGEAIYREKAVVPRRRTAGAHLVAAVPRRAGRADCRDSGAVRAVRAGGLPFHADVEPGRRAEVRTSCSGTPTAPPARPR